MLLRVLLNVSWMCEIFLSHHVNVPGSDEGVDKHHADPAMLAEEDRDALEDPGIGLDERDPAADTGCARLSQEHLEEIVSNNSHLGLGRPAEGIEDVEIPWGLPFAPCPTIEGGDTGLKENGNTRPGSNRG
jgi:hypothetical protein